MARGRHHGQQSRQENFNRNQFSREQLNRNQQGQTQNRRFNTGQLNAGQQEREVGWREDNYRRGRSDYYQEDYPDGGRDVYTRAGRGRDFVEDRYDPYGERNFYNEPHAFGDTRAPHGGRAGRSSYGSSKYGGSDYQNGDYNRTAAERTNDGGPYTMQASGDDRSDIVGNNWSRSSGVGEWSSDTRLYGDDNSVGYDPGSWAPRRSTHQGRGPKGYERSDDRIKELVCERLTDAPSLDASEIVVEVKNHEVSLTGSVDSRSAKHLAEDLVESVGGITEINNQLKVIGNGNHAGRTS